MRWAQVPASAVLTMCSSMCQGGRATRVRPANRHATSLLKIAGGHGGSCGGSRRCRVDAAHHLHVDGLPRPIHVRSGVRQRGAARCVVLGQGVARKHALLLQPRVRLDAADAAGRGRGDGGGYDERWGYCNDEEGDGYDAEVHTARPEVAAAVSHAQKAGGAREWEWCALQKVTHYVFLVCKAMLLNRRSKGSYNRQA